MATLHQLTPTAFTNTVGKNYTVVAFRSSSNGVAITIPLNELQN